MTSTAAAFPFPSLEGKAGDITVSWIVSHEDDTERKEELEELYLSASELSQLLIRNAYTMEGLSPAEMQEALDLIKTLPENENSECGACSRMSPESEVLSKTIADTSLCRWHNEYALRSKK